MGIPSEQGINREVSARASIGGDRSDRSIPRTVQRGLSRRSGVVVGKKVGRAAMEVTAKQDPTAFVVSIVMLAICLWVVASVESGLFRRYYPLVQIFGHLLSVAAAYQSKRQ